MSNSPEVYAAKQAKGELVQKMWKEGRTSREIREQVGWATSQLTMQMSRMRDAGWDLPYRYDRARRAKMRAGRKHGRPRGR